MSEMEFLDLAPGDPISQGGSLREFRYSQFSECPSAPYNTAEPEYLPSQFHMTASLATSPLLESEGRRCMLNDGRLGEPPSSLPCSQLKADAFVEGVECNPLCGERLQSGSFISDCPKLSLLGAAHYLGSKESECRTRSLGEETHACDGSVPAQQDSPLLFPVRPSPRRMYCDPRLLEAETQVFDVGGSVAAQQDSPLRHSSRRMYCDPRLLEEETQVFDVGVSDSKQQDSHLLFTTEHSQLAPQTSVAELEKSLPVRAVNEGCHATVEEVADICHRWHNRKRTALPVTAVLSSSACASLPSAKHEIVKPSTSRALDVDDFQGQPSDLEPMNPSTANQTSSAIVEDDVDAVQRSHNKRRISLAALSSLNLPTNIRLPMETKGKITEPSTSDVMDADRCRGHPTVVEPENASPTSANQKILTAVEDDSDIVQRWHKRKRIALSAITNLSSSSDKKLKTTPDKSVVSGAALRSTELQDQLVEDRLHDNTNVSVPQSGFVTPCMDATSSRSGSETIEEGANVNDDTGGCCDSKLLRRKLNYSSARDIKSFLQPVTAPNRPTTSISSTNEVGASKQEHAEEKWIHLKKNRSGGRQRTMDAWIK